MTADARSLHCPNCGAAADPDAPRCGYCRARLATVSCPSCFARLFDGAAFCPSCGARRARTAAPPGSTACPSCRTAMTGVDVGATPLLECGACDGVWVDAAPFEALCANAEAQAAVVHRFGTRQAPAAASRIRYRPCPRCNTMMNRMNFGRLSGTIVDVCRGHGTFLDAGELHAIVSFIQSGGLDRARQRQLEELREQERRLKAAETRAARDRGRSDPHASLDPGSDMWSADAVKALIDAING